MIFAADQENLISALQFLVRSGIDDAGAIPFDANDARSGLGSQFQLDNHFSGGFRAGLHFNGFQPGLAQEGRSRREPAPRLAA